jgi:hypothetical protein
MMKKETSKKSIKYYPEENEAYWKQHQFGFLASGFSRRKYCQKHEVNYDRFNYWFKKLSSHQEGLPAPKKESSEKNSLFLPVHLTQPKAETLSTSLSTPLCTVNFKNGHSLMIHHERAFSLLLEQWR